MSYYTGMTVRLEVTFKNFADAETDPTTVKVFWRTGLGAAGTSTYVSSGTDNWTRVSAGVYTYDLAVTTPGEHTYSFEGTGTVPVYDTASFRVSQRPVG